MLETVQEVHLMGYISAADNTGLSSFL